MCANVGATTSGVVVTPRIAQLSHLLDNADWCLFAEMIKDKPLQLASVRTEGQFFETAVAAGISIEKYPELQRIGQDLSARALFASEAARTKYPTQRFHRAGDAPEASPVPEFTARENPDDFRGSTAGSIAYSFPFDPEIPSESYMFVRQLADSFNRLHATVSIISQNVNRLSDTVGDLALRVTEIERRGNEITDTLNVRMDEIVDRLAKIRTNADDHALSVASAAGLGARSALQECLSDTPSIASDLGIPTRTPRPLSGRLSVSDLASQFGGSLPGLSSPAQSPPRASGSRFSSAPGKIEEGDTE